MRRHILWAGALAMAVAALPMASASNAQAGAAARAPMGPPISATPEGGIRIGSATARAALVEYVSYTCPHCATYDAESHDILRTNYIARGTTSVEVRPLVRDALDLASAVVARCGTPNRFFERHHALMARQEAMFSAARASQAGWAAVPPPQRLQRIASDAGIIAAVAPLGVTTAQANACLADQPAIERIIAIAEGGRTLGVTGTPSFLLNGRLLENVHSWSALRPRIDAALAAR